MLMCASIAALATRALHVTWTTRFGLPIFLAGVAVTVLLPLLSGIWLLRLNLGARIAAFVYVFIQLGVVNQYRGTYVPTVVVVLAAVFAYLMLRKGSRDAFFAANLPTIIRR